MKEYWHRRQERAAMKKEANKAKQRHQLQAHPQGGQGGLRGGGRREDDEHSVLLERGAGLDAGGDPEYYKANTAAKPAEPPPDYGE